ncbi:mRNA capping enzyme, large subunit [Aulographum hederae CBS 113979]|uniref:mRNA cap guanine-N(7) methyltransferase n=1 Tax=Aulographum hederae CBS 113979 TaxID=1176131 RepID=A0A6G1GN02_9PEZI|nr:mRNA capping enzyme, large subunit [Aulographum hederae CBS 113979]
MTSTEQPTNPRKRSLSRSRSPPRQRKRPGATAKLTAAPKAASPQPTLTPVRTGVQNIVTSHYNSVPERGRSWRQTSSEIVGLRNLNNWVKSVLIGKCTPEDTANVLDIGCGKGGDLGKWQASRKIERYVGLDPADVSIQQARERYGQMTRRAGRRGIFDARFFVKDCFGETVGNIPEIAQLGFDAEGVKAGYGQGGGFDVVTMMFCMHYAFENEQKARIMLSNVAAALRKGGRLIGVAPNSDVISEKVVEYHKKLAEKEAAKETSKPEEQKEQNGDTAEDDEQPDKGDEKSEKEGSEDDTTKPKATTDTESDPPSPLKWGNKLYSVSFPPAFPPPPASGIFRPPFGWKYSYWLTEAVEAPEYVVPWEAFRGLADDYNLELDYRKSFEDVWKEEKDDPVFGPLSEKMKVTDRNGRFQVCEKEMEAAGFYHAFAFRKV